MGKKRANGEGTVFQVKSGKYIGQWVAKYQLDTFTESGQHKFWSAYRKTEKEAINALLEFKIKLTTGKFNPNKSTLNDFYAHWIEHKKLEVSVRTLEIYDETIARHALPRLGKIKLANLTTADVRGLLADLAVKKSLKTANRVRKELSGMLGSAFRDELVNLNVVTRIKPYKVEVAEKLIWSQTEAVKFLDVASSHRLYPAFSLAMSTGMRVSEVLGLRWQDVGETHLRVNQGLTKAKKTTAEKTHLRIGPPKTQGSKREVPLSAQMGEVLTHWKAVQERERTLLGEMWGQEVDDKLKGLVFTTAIGKPIDPRNLSKSLKSLIKKAGVPNISIHGLRHFHGSWKLSLGYTDVEIAAMQGHSVRMFGLTYSHVLPERVESIARPLSDLRKKIEVEAEKGK